MEWIRRTRRRGRPPHPDVLTPAEWRVVEQIRLGRTNAEIAVRLGVSPNTVKTHVSRILAKVGVADRAEIAAWRGVPSSGAPREGRGLGVPLLGWLSKGGLATGGQVAVLGGLVVVLGAGFAVALAWYAEDGAGGEPVAASTETPGDELPLQASGTSCPPDPSGRVTVADWVDFIHFDGIRYLRTVQPVTASPDLGPVYDRVGFRYEGNCVELPRRAEHGDSARLDEGTEVHTVVGYSPSFRLAVEHDGETMIYEADSRPDATTGAGLLDLAGKVVSIVLSSSADGRYELARLDEPDQIVALVDQVLTAPVDHSLRTADEPYLFVAFHLADGTVVSRGYGASRANFIAASVCHPRSARRSTRRSGAAPTPSPSPALRTRAPM